MVVLRKLCSNPVHRFHAVLDITSFVPSLVGELRYAVFSHRVRQDLPACLRRSSECNLALRSCLDLCICFLNAHRYVSTIFVQCYSIFALCVLLESCRRHSCCASARFHFSRSNTARVDRLTVAVLLLTVLDTLCCTLSMAKYVFRLVCLSLDFLS
jgi:hypothetical protein